jgi:hypothetical protein
MQYNSPGFMRNARQHRQFGLACLELAQTALRHWASDGGLVVADAASSSPKYWKSRSWRCAVLSLACLCRVCSRRYAVDARRPAVCLRV